MCGIVGVVSNFKHGFSQPEINAFEKMLFLSTFRGWDSTGVFIKDNKHNISIAKEASIAPVFMQTPEYKEIAKHAYASGKFMIGHTRAATRGTISDKNAHPFYVNDNIILVQNGSWYGSHKEVKDTEVDSEVIAHILDEEEDIEKAFHKVNAAYALVWYNVKEKSLYLVRNSQRPLYVSYHYNDTMLFASELETINYVVAKNEWKMKETAPFLLKENVVHQITFNDDGTTSSKNINIKQHTVITPSPQYGGGTSSVSPFPSHTTLKTSSVIGDSKKEQLLFIKDFKFECFDSDDFLLTEEQADEACESFMNMVHKSKNKNYIIELEDYYPANKEQNCRSFYIWGTVALPDVGVMTKVVSYALFRDFDELEVVSQVAHGFYSVQFMQLTRCKIKDKYIIFNLVNDLQPIDVTP